jgi:phosphatidylserine decarboxylase
MVEHILALGADPNATAAGDEFKAGTVPGSTPSVSLAATRGYHKVLEVFKKNEKTNFLIENKFKQTILHVVLKAGYYNKIVVHGEDSGENNIATLRGLFDGNNLLVQQQARI